MPVAYGSNAKRRLREQTDPFLIATGDFAQLPFFSIGLAASQPLQRDDMLGVGTGRDGSEPYLDALSVSGDAVLPIDLNNIGYILKMLLGTEVVTGSGADKVHTWTSGKTVLPAYSIEVAHPDLGAYRQFIGVRANTLSADLAPGGPARVSVGLMGMSETTLAASAAGSPTIAPVTRFMNPTGYVKRDGVQLGQVLSGNIRFGNGMNPVRTIRPDNRLEEIELGTSTGGGTITTRYADNSLIAQAISGAPVLFEYGWSISATKYLKLEFPRSYLSRPGAQVSGPGGIELPATWEAAYDPTAGYMMKATLANQFAAY